MNIKEFNMYEIVDFIIGHTDIACETYYDDKSYENLEYLNDIAIYIMRKLYDNAEWFGDYRASASMLADKSIRIAENIKEWCDDIISKKGGSNE